MQFRACKKCGTHQFWRPGELLSLLGFLLGTGFLHDCAGRWSRLRSLPSADMRKEVMIVNTIHGMLSRWETNVDRIMEYMLYTYPF